MNPLPATLLVATVIGVGAYLVAVMDLVIGSRVARVRPAGSVWLLPLAQLASLSQMRRSVTERPDREAWALAPPLLAGLAAVALTAIPLAPGVAVADVRAGIVLFGAAMLQVMVAVFLHGWGPNSTMPMLGSFRMAALVLSMSVPFSLVVIATAMPAESLRVGEIIASQESLWNVVRQPLGLPIYLVTALGFAFWGPLGLPDAADLAAGTGTESSGVVLALWRMARIMVLVALAVMGAAAFLGGYLGPWLPGWSWMVLKTLVLAMGLLWAGHRFARVRMETAVQLGWLVLLPLALVDVFASGVLTL